MLKVLKLLKLLKVLRETIQSIQNIESVGNIINIAVPYIITDLINNVKARDPVGSKNVVPLLKFVMY